MNRAAWADLVRAANSEVAVRPRKRRVNMEHYEQALVIQWCEDQAMRTPELRLIFAIPNQSQGSVMRGKYYKAEGQKSGVPDLFLPVARKQYHGMFIEMKSKSGRILPEQQAWAKALTEQGYYACFAFGANEAIERIMGYMFSGEEVK